MAENIVENLKVMDIKQQQEEDKVFNLVLVDMWDIKYNGDFTCVKKNMYEKGLQYITISYRWGEWDEQLLKTPDYKAHITSFDLWDLGVLCEHIRKEPDLKDIQYLWVDAISVDQQNHERKKETILQMSNIYKRATYILAVPDLHLRHLKINPANFTFLACIERHCRIIYQDIHKSIQSDIKQEEKEEKEERVEKESDEKDEEDKLLELQKIQDIKNAYHYLAFLLEDWSNRAWVISEYQIAREKQNKNATPLKYIFITLLHAQVSTFFSYTFHHHQDITQKSVYNGPHMELYNLKVDTSDQFFQFLKIRLTQRHPLFVFLSSRATRNEDRFHAILPSWEEYSNVIQHKSTISNWKISGMTSVRLKLYEIMDNVWDKARLLRGSIPRKAICLNIFPSFASRQDMTYFRIMELDDATYANEKLTVELIYYEKDVKGNTKKKIITAIEENIRKYLLEHGSIYTENLTSIQLIRNLQDGKDEQDEQDELPCLAIKSKMYFIFHNNPDDDLYEECLANYPFENNGNLRVALIPFFSFAIPEYKQVPPTKGSGITLLGDVVNNKWIACDMYMDHELLDTCQSDDYTFHIY
ncbi:unnamed protein product [Cunninghamella echinulata]